MKLNKNQKKFMELALIHFGARASEVSLKDLRAFSVENELIIPTTALKECKLKRGSFDLTKCGLPMPLTAFIESEVPERTVPTTDEISPILAVPVYSDSPVRKVKTTTEPKVAKPAKRHYTDIHKRPVYVVTNYNDGFIAGVKERFSDAFEMRMQVLHDHGCASLAEAENECDERNFVVIKSVNSCMKCGIFKRDLDAVTLFSRTKGVQDEVPNEVVDVAESGLGEEREGETGDVGSEVPEVSQGSEGESSTIDGLDDI